MADMEKDEQLNNAAEKMENTKPVGRRAFIGALTAAALAACKTKKEDPAPQAGETEAERVAREKKEAEEKAEKDRLEKERLEKEAKEKAEKERLEKERLEKEAKDSRDRAKFGGGFGEFYGVPAGWEDHFQNDFKAYVQNNLKGKFGTIVVEPAAIKPDMLPEAIARLNFTGVDPNNETHRPLVEKLKAINNAYLTKGSEVVKRENLQLLNFNNPAVVGAVKEYILNFANQYNGALILGGANFENAIYENELDRSQIQSFRSALKDVASALGNKKLIIGDLRAVAPEDMGKPGAVNNLATYARTLTPNLHFYVPPQLDLNTDLWTRYYMQQDGANLHITALGKPVTKENASALKTAIGIATDSNNYPAPPVIANTYFTNTNSDKSKAPKIAAANVYMSSDYDLLSRDVPGQNKQLADGALRVATPAEVPDAKILDAAMQGLVRETREQQWAHTH